MAEFCIDCWNQINKTNDSKWRYALPWEKDLCEECGQYKRVIIAERLWSRTQRTISEISGNIRQHKENTKQVSVGVDSECWKN